MKQSRTSAMDVIDLVKALMQAYPTQAIAHQLNVTPETARNWKRGRSAPRAAELIDLLRHYPEFRHEINRLAGPVFYSSYPLSPKENPDEPRDRTASQLAFGF